MCITSPTWWSTILRPSRTSACASNLARRRSLLDTGGGLKKAAWFFLQDASDEPFLLHNVDVVSDIDLAADGASSTARSRPWPRWRCRNVRSSRQLLFDEDGLLCGRRFEKEGRTELARQADPLRPLAFCGVHVISPRMLEKMTEDGVFSIIESYLRLAGKGEKIVAYRANEAHWRDLGTLESLERARKDLS